MLRKVQAVSLLNMNEEARNFMADDYQRLGFTTEIVGDELICWWGKPDKPKKKDDKKKRMQEPEHKPGQEKTARRLGR